MSNCVLPPHKDVFANAQMLMVSLVERILEARRLIRSEWQLMTDDSYVQCKRWNGGILNARPHGTSITKRADTYRCPSPLLPCCCVSRGRQREIVTVWLDRRRSRCAETLTVHRKERGRPDRCTCTTARPCFTMHDTKKHSNEKERNISSQLRQG